jgi:hypothetical protein
VAAIIALPILDRGAVLFSRLDRSKRPVETSGAAAPGDVQSLPPGKIRVDLWGEQDDLPFGS